MTTILHAIDIAALSPLLILLAGALLVILLETFAPEFSKKFSFYATLGVIAAALFATVVAPSSDNALLTPWLKFDPLARLFTFIFLAVGFATTLLSKSFFQRFEASHGEYFFLLLASLFGLILIGSAADFLTLFLGLETLSISLYVLCGYMKRWKISHESAIKYFLMGALAAAFLLYGIALIYGAVGNTQFASLMTGYSKLSSLQDKVIFFSGIAFVTLGLAFKATIVPFHLWAPDVYEGAPTPVTAFMAVGTKAGAFAAFVRIFMEALPHFDPRWSQGIALLAIPTLIYANFVALRQVQLRRFFAYSGISHAGYLLIPLAVGTPEALSALLFYFVVYALATLGCFAVLAFLDQHTEGVVLHDLRGLFNRSPLLAGILSLCLLTLGGIPPTAGFFAKFYLFKLAFQAGYIALVVIALLTTILSAYYYLRIIGVMFSEASSEETLNWRHSWAAAAVGTATFAAILFLSVFPSPLINFLSQMH